MSNAATGPRTAEGKERSSRNATAHGLRSERPIVPGEDAAEWDAFRAQAVAELAPGSFLERELAERVALQLWRLRRAARYEAEVAEDEFHSVRMDSLARFAYLEPEQTVAQALVKEVQEITEQMKTIDQLEKGRKVLRHLPNLVNSAPLDTVEVLPLMAMLGIADPNELPPPLTAKGLRRALMDWSGMTLVAAQQWATEITAAKVQTMVERLEGMKKQKASLQAQMQFQVEAQQRDRRLLTKAALDRVVRYEAHVSRQLNQALTLLRQFKDERLARGRETQAPPVAEAPAARETLQQGRVEESPPSSFGNGEAPPAAPRQPEGDPIESPAGEKEFVRNIVVETERERGGAAVVGGDDSSAAKNRFIKEMRADLTPGG